MWFDNVSSSLPVTGNFQLAATANELPLSLKVNHDEILILLRNGKAKG